MTSAVEELPRALGGRTAAALHARALLRDLGVRPQDAGTPIAALEADSCEARDWARSGAMALTGAAGGPPLAARGAPASALRAALLVFDLLTRARGAPVGGLPGVELLGERAAAAGLSRNAPSSPRGAFRFVRAVDGWVGINLARPSDLDVLPALIEGFVGDDHWETVASWACSRNAEAVADRAQLLGVPAAVVGAALPACPPVGVLAGGARVLRAAPLVVDLTSLWAGPLCAHLLGLSGCRVVKVESTRRPDGARRGAPALYDLLHAGHEAVALDFTDPRDLERLHALVATADVVLESSRPRALGQLGIVAEDHVARGTTWASITAYGRSSLWSDRVGLGDDVAAAAGLVAARHGEPWPAGDALADPLTGVHAAAAVAASLATGSGHLLDVSLYAVAAAAAALPREDFAAHRTHRGWDVDGVHVADPVVRPASRAAAPLGADTAAVLEDLL